MIYFKSRNDQLIPKNGSGEQVFLTKNQLLTKKELIQKFERMPGRLIPKHLKEVEVSSKRTIIVNTRRYENA